MSESSQEHLVNHLRDVHAIELHSMRQLERAARRRDEETSSVYEAHLEESQTHDQKLSELMQRWDRESTAVEDKTLRGRMIGIRQLADVALDTPVKLAMNLFAVEHLEIAAYELLAELARAADDDEIAGVAEEILEQERAAVERVEATFDHAVELLVEGSSKRSPDDSSESDSDDSSESSSEDGLLLAHLSDVHALEQQSLQLLRMGIEDVCQDEQLAKTYKQHLEQTEQHEQLIGERLDAHDAKPSAVRDLHMGAAKTGLNELAAKPPDGDAKLAMNLLCVEHLEIAGYEFLIRIAERSGDSETAEVARKILDEEREAVNSVREGFGHVVELMLQSDASYEPTQKAEAEVPAGQASEA